MQDNKNSLRAEIVGEWANFVVNCIVPALHDYVWPNCLALAEMPVGVGGRNVRLWLGQDAPTNKAYN